MSKAERNPKKPPQSHETPKSRKGERGSPAPMDGKCGSYLRGSDPPRYCKKDPVRGRTRCKLHGGNTPIGPDSPHWVHGQRSRLYKDLLSGSLLKGYLALQTDEDLIRTEEQIRIWAARERELVERLTAESGESAASWRAARMAMGEVDGAKNPTDLAAALTKLRAVVLIGAGHEDTWADLERCHETIRKLKDSERRRREGEHTIMTVDQVVQLGGLLTSLALRYITDDRMKIEFAEGVQRLSRGEHVDVGPGLVLGGKH